MRILPAVGGLLAAAGLAYLAMTSWELWGTAIPTQQAQSEASTVLVTQPAGSPVHEGEPVTRIRIPAIQADWVVLEGTTEQVLADGPGHYIGTAMPGEEGNVGIAGHRVTHGAPFNRLDELRPCDDIWLAAPGETWHYRVLPDVGTPSGCGLPTVPVSGRDVVDPSRSDVLNPVRGQALLTLTTCHPEYSARQRLIVRAVLVS